MGIDWQPFLLKPGVSKENFEALAAGDQRRFFSWRVAGNDLPGSAPDLERHVIFGMSEESPQYADTMRVPSFAEHVVFPKTWHNELYKTLSAEETARRIDKRIAWVEGIRGGELPVFLKLRYLEYARDGLREAWENLQECVTAVRKRQNAWAQRDNVLTACRYYASIAPPRSFPAKIAADTGMLSNAFLATIWKNLGIWMRLPMKRKTPCAS